MVSILPEFAPNGALLKLDSEKQPETAQSLRMMYFGNVPGGIVFSDTQPLFVRLFSSAVDEPAELCISCVAQRKRKARVRPSAIS